MKKLLLLGLLLSLSTGCGRGWLPGLSRGTSCRNGGCIGAAPALPQGCTTCVGGNAAGYGSYEGNVSGGEIMADSGSYIGESYADTSYPSAGGYSGAIVSPNIGMAPLGSNPLPAPAP
jgi:hypothetical protein